MVTFDSLYRRGPNAYVYQHETFKVQPWPCVPRGAGQAANGIGRGECTLASEIAPPGKASGLIRRLFVSRPGRVGRKRKRAGKTLDIDRVRHKAGIRSVKMQAKGRRLEHDGAL